MDLISVIEDGFRLWKKNIIIGVPYLLSLMVTAFLIVLALTAFILSLAYLELVGRIICGVILLVLLYPVCGLTWAFFEVAAISMSYKAMEGGKPDIHDALNPTLSYVSKVFTIRITTGTLLFFLFILFGVIRQIIHIDLITPVNLLAGAILMFAPYYAIFTKRNWFEAIKSGYKLFKENKLIILLLWTMTYYVGFFTAYFIIPPLLVLASPLPIAGFIAGVAQPTLTWFLFFSAALLFTLFMLFTILASTLVVAPLSTLWVLGAYRKIGDGK